MNLIARVLDQSSFVCSFDFRLGSILGGGGLLFGGGYNIYRERLIWGASLFGGGALLGSLSLISGGLLS